MKYLFVGGPQGGELLRLPDQPPAYVSFLTGDTYRQVPVGLFGWTFAVYAHSSVEGRELDDLLWRHIVAHRVRKAVEQ